MSSMDRQTATSIRYGQMAMEIARDRLTKFPECQPEAIANHYVSLATMALQLLKMIDARKNCARETSQHIESAIDFYVTEIKRHHAHHLGIALEWTNTKP